MTFQRNYNRPPSPVGKTTPAPIARAGKIATFVAAASLALLPISMHYFRRLPFTWAAVITLFGVALFILILLLQRQGQKILKEQQERADMDKPFVN